MIFKFNSYNKNNWYLFYPIIFTALCLRIIYSFFSDVPVHEDEIMQYLEQAHRLVFDYGYIPWEYDKGIQPWFIPGIISLILFILKFFSLDYPVIYVNIIKLFFCFVSLLIPIGMYSFAKLLFSDNTAKLSLVLGSFWYEFIFFSHKPLPGISSTCLVFLALTFFTKQKNYYIFFLDYSLLLQ